jgi:triosephosphate isomerase
MNLTAQVVESGGVREKLIFGNWKMHTTAAEAGRLARAVAAGVGREDRVRVAIFPPFPHLALVGEILQGSRVALGAQNLYPENEGAFTGEVSPTMLLDVGCRYVILGHSERRKMGETDRFINQKVKIALEVGLEVIFCIGESLEQRQARQTPAILNRQLTQGLVNLSDDHRSRLSVAYEPIWAIGNTGHQATPQQAHDSHALIRDHFAQLFGQESAQSLRILYGGSVKPDNASALLTQEGVDGALVGGASLDALEFLAIIRAGAAAARTLVA